MSASRARPSAPSAGIPSESVPTASLRSRKRGGFGKQKLAYRSRQFPRERPDVRFTWTRRFRRTAIPLAARCKSRRHNGCCTLSIASGRIRVESQSHRRNFFPSGERTRNSGGVADALLFRARRGPSRLFLIVNVVFTTVISSWPSEYLRGDIQIISIGCSLERVEANKMTEQMQSHIYYPGTAVAALPILFSSDRPAGHPPSRFFPRFFPRRPSRRGGSRNAVMNTCESGYPPVVTYLPGSTSDACSS